MFWLVAGTEEFSSPSRLCRCLCISYHKRIPTHLMISRPSAATRYCTIHRHASLLLESSISTVAIHSSVSTLAKAHKQIYLVIMQECFTVAENISRVYLFLPTSISSIVHSIDRKNFMHSMLAALCRQRKVVIKVDRSIWDDTTMQNLYTRQ